MAFADKYFYVKETSSFYCWEYKLGRTDSKLYIPKWRVPQPTPQTITVIVSTNFEFEENGVTERDILKYPGKKTLPIIVLGERVSDHEYTARFDTGNYNKQINSLYVPYTFLEPCVDEKKVMIKILWE